MLVVAVIKLNGANLYNESVYQDPLFLFNYFSVIVSAHINVDSHH